MTARDTDLLKDRSLLGRRADTLARYHEALTMVVVESLASGGGESKPLGSGAKDSSVTPNAVMGWASDLLTVEMDALRYRARRLENWVERPRPVEKRKRKRCATCGNGIQRGAKFCPQCGDPTT